MTATTPVPNTLSASYLTLRRWIGVIGFAMPLLVKLGAWCFQGVGGTTSISAYYYTDMRDVFVGSLVTIGVFMAFYQSSIGDWVENRLTNLAGLAAICIGFFPTETSYPPVIINQHPGVTDPTYYRPGGPLGYHMYAVTAFFAILIYVTIFKFTKTLPGPVSKRKQERNMVYRVCGVVMLLAVAAIGYLEATHAAQSIFWPETIAIAAFSVAWLTKGQAIPFLKEEVSGPAQAIAPT